MSLKASTNGINRMDDISIYEQIKNTKTTYYIPIQKV